MARVELEHLTKVFQGPAGEEVRAVDGASLRIEAGELLVLVGPSGCGKTTLLRLVAGLEEPTSGTIRIDSVVANGMSPKARDVGMVFQSPALYPHLSAHDNMAFGLKLRRVTKHEREERVSQAAEWLGLTDCLARRPMELSGGQRQRVALGRAVVRRPKVILLDEPLSNLDAPLRARMRTDLAKLQQRLGVTMVYVTHDQAEARALGKRLAVMHAGVIQQIGEPRELYERPANLLVAGFLGAPAMNLVAGRMAIRGNDLLFECPGPRTEAQVVLKAGTTTELHGLAGKPVVLGLRPQDVVADFADMALAGVVELVEGHGPETFAHMKIGDQTWVARVESGRAVRVGERTGLRLDMTKAHWFEETGKRIG